jgi:hypothetical protein
MAHHILNIHRMILLPKPMLELDSREVRHNLALMSTLISEWLTMLQVQQNTKLKIKQISLIKAPISTQMYVSYEFNIEIGNFRSRHTIQ